MKTHNINIFSLCTGIFFHQIYDSGLNTELCDLMKVLRRDSPVLEEWRWSRRSAAAKSSISKRRLSVRHSLPGPHRPIERAGGNPWPRPVQTDADFLRAATERIEFSSPSVSKPQRIRDAALRSITETSSRDFSSKQDFFPVKGAGRRYSAPDYFSLKFFKYSLISRWSDQ